MSEQTMQKRQTAYKVSVKDIISGKYFVEEGWSPNYVLTENGIKVSRVNILATLISVSGEEEIQQFIFVDDGSAEIAVRSFNDSVIFKGLKIGDLLQIIGKVRAYNEEKYIVPEIIKILDNKKWIYVRKIELERREISTSEKSDQEEKPAAKQDSEKSIDMKEYEDVLKIIKGLDKGDGADFEEVVKSCTEERVNNLLMNGEIFELKPGKLKVLE